MRKSLMLAVACTPWLMFTGSAIADPISTAADPPITYDVNLPVDGGSVIGSITTDGAIGLLFNGDITAWNLTLTDPTGTANLTSGVNSTVFISPGSLTATATELLFNFNGSGSFVNFNGPSPGCPPQLVFRTDGGTSCNGATGDVIALSTTQAAGAGPGAITGSLLGQTVEIGGEIPEPGTVGLMVSGLVGFCLSGCFS